MKSFRIYYRLLDTTAHLMSHFTGISNFDNIHQNLSKISPFSAHIITYLEPFPYNLPYAIYLLTLTFI